MVHSVLTGSRVYGRPRPDSDWDLVVLVKESDLARLRTAAREEPDGDTGDGSAEEFLTRVGAHRAIGPAASLRFGDMNLICVTDPVTFFCWSEGTKQLKARAPVTREQAVETFQALFRIHGVAKPLTREELP